MASSTVTLPTSIPAGEFGASLDCGDRSEFVDAPGRRNRSARGAITGIVLGVGLWSAILIAFGVIKL